MVVSIYFSYKYVAFVAINIIFIIFSSISIEYLRTTKFQLRNGSHFIFLLCRIYLT
jgi:hypothetical protein